MRRYHGHELKKTVSRDDQVQNHLHESLILDLPSNELNAQNNIEHLEQDKNPDEHIDQDGTDPVQDSDPRQTYLLSLQQRL